MRIEIEGLHVKVVNGEGKEIVLALSEAGIAVSTDRLTLETNQTSVVRVTVPFAAPEGTDT